MNGSMNKSVKILEQAFLVNKLFTEISSFVWLLFWSNEQTVIFTELLSQWFNDSLKTYTNKYLSIPKAIKLVSEQITEWI